MKEKISEQKTRTPYREPKTAVIEMDTSGLLCQSNPDQYGTDFGNTEDIF